MNTTKRILIIITCSFFLNHFSIAQSSGADGIIGTWLMPDDDGIIEVYKEGEFYNGKIVWMKEKEEDGKPLKDKKNPDESLRNRTVEGLQVMSGFKYKGGNLWSGGNFYAALKGKEVEPDFVLVNKDQLNIEISIFIFSKTVELKRVNTTEFFNNRNMLDK